MDSARFANILEYFKGLIEEIKAIIKEVMAFIENPYVETTTGE